MYYKKIKIGNYEIENNIFLAPMAGITDKPYRMICKEMGAGLVYTEMISSRAIYHDDTKTKLIVSHLPLHSFSCVQYGPSGLQAFRYGCSVPADAAARWRRHGSR